MSEISVHTDFILSFLQLISISVKEDEPVTKLLADNQGSLDGVTDLRIEFRSVGNAVAATLELRVLGCIKGRYLYIFGLNGEHKGINGFTSM